MSPFNIAQLRNLSLESGSTGAEAKTVFYTSGLDIEILSYLQREIYKKKTLSLPLKDTCFYVDSRVLLYQVWENNLRAIYTSCRFWLQNLSKKKCLHLTENLKLACTNMCNWYSLFPTGCSFPLNEFNLSSSWLRISAFVICNTGVNDLLCFFQCLLKPSAGF